MSTPKLILCEKSPRWAIALRRSLGRDAPILAQTRALPACGRELASAPASLVAVEIVPGNVEHVLAAWADWSGQFPAARLVALADRPLAAAESLLREGGACSVVTSVRHAGRVARLALRHLALVPQPALPLREAIWQRLPWPRHAASPA
jgi:hypothetical protein